MGKLGKYLLIASGVLLLMYFAGIVENNGTSTLLSLLVNPENLFISGVLSRVVLIAITGALVVTGITIASFSYQRPDMLILIPIVLVFFDIIFGVLEIYNKIISVNPDYKIFGLLLFGPVLVLLFMVIIDWWRGTDQ
jgi:hypothetical protein